ncbi:FHA domain-containing protein, partial [Streptomyces sp. CC77]|uniref:FHA domain-containing protein n=1 Tax=Streptomyces sp. CC77 TaxID=1906739 RepID=UPI0011139CFF
MQIRLTVLAAPTGGQTARRACDVLVTAPAGTALAAVASGLAAAAAGPDGAAASGAVVLYAGGERLDPQRATLGEPPLVDGAVLGLQAPAGESAAPEGAAARLHVVAGPDAGGVHLLHPGEIRVGRSADADVPLDDPDVSRLHCVVTVTEDGRVRVADLGSTNGTSLDGRAVGERAVRLAPGALLRVGETALRLAPGAAGHALAAVPDGEGHLRVAREGTLSTRGADPGTEQDGPPQPMVPSARRPYGEGDGTGSTGGAAGTLGTGGTGGTGVTASAHPAGHGARAGTPEPSGAGLAGQTGAGTPGSGPTGPGRPGFPRQAAAGPVFPPTGTGPDRGAGAAPGAAAAPGAGAAAGEGHARVRSGTGLGGPGHAADHPEAALPAPSAA